MSVFSFLVAMCVSIRIVILVVRVLSLHALVVMELVLKKFGVLNQIIVNELVALLGLK